MWPSRRNVLVELARDVYSVLGLGRTEAVYHSALAAALRHRGVPYESEVVVPVQYRGTVVGYGRADLVIDHGLVVELKAQSRTIREPDRAQLRAYMRDLNISSGMLINFPQPTTSAVPSPPPSKSTVAIVFNDTIPRASKKSVSPSPSPSPPASPRRRKTPLAASGVTMQIEYESIEI